MATMLPSEADAVVRELTDGKMRVEENIRGVFLVHDTTLDKVQLLAYQMTAEGLDAAVAEFWEPQAI